MKKLLLPVLLCCGLLARAQNNNAPSSKDVHDIKITGYLQMQFQKAQSPGITSFSGGDFSEHSDSRFMIRRGRLKIDRVDKFSNIVFQLDATQNGVNLMDAFVQLHAPKIDDFLLTAGLFNRPFGYSVVYSSGYRDFPERARVFQTLMPKERDLGVMLSYNPTIANKQFVEADLAVVNGSGITARDYDSRKDIIGNINFKFDSLLNNRLALGFGASIYSGSVRNPNKTFYSSSKTGFIANTDALNEGKNLNRKYYGVNLQVELNHGFGKTAFKTEYIEGQQPGIASAANISGPLASTSFSAQPATSLYIRNFNGYYFWLTQQIGRSKFNALVAYDVYDPNTDISDSQIGAMDSNTTAGDIRFNTLGYGMAYAVNSRIKFTLYNEHVINKATQLADYQNDLKDGVFTARIQYRW